MCGCNPQATHCVGILTLILLSIIFIAAVLLVGFTTVWLALAFVTMEGTEVTGNAIFNEATTPDIKNVCPEVRNNNDKALVSYHFVTGGLRTRPRQNHRRRK